MKISKYILGIAVAATAALASCDTDNEGAIYKPYSENISFETEEPAEVLVEETSTEVTVRLTRNITKGEYTAHYTSETNADGIFTDENNGSVTFADGEGSAYITLKVDNMEKGNTYTNTLTLSDADIATTDTITNTSIVSTTITVTCDYNWLDAGTCTFTDFTFSDGGSAEDVEIKHAEGTNIYRIMSPYQAVFPDDDDVADAGNITFYLNDDNSANGIEAGFGTYVAGYYFYYDTTNYPGYCSMTNDGNSFVVNFLLTDGTSLYPGGLITFVWDGWPGND